MEEERVERVRSRFQKERVWCGRVESEHVGHLGGDAEQAVGFIPWD